MAESPTSRRVPDLDLVTGGPTHRLFVAAGLARERAPLLARQALAAVVLAWLPLAVLSTLEGRAFGGVAVPFFRDPAPQARFLFALPLLVLAQALIGPRLIDAASRFVRSGLVPDEKLPAFSTAVERALRRRDFWFIEPLLFAAAVAVSILARQQGAQGPARWDLLGGEGERVRTLAGWWAVAVSASLFSFLFYRWLWRLGIWYAFLRDAAKLGLRLVPTHPDRMGGLGFLPAAQTSFNAVVFAFSAAASGVFAREVLFDGVALKSLAAPVAGFVVAVLLVFVAPLLLFAPHLAAARRAGLADYGALASAYVREFDDKWVRGRPEGEALLGSGDVQSLADIGASFERVSEMTVLPATKGTVVGVVLAALTPILPVLLTKVPLKELLKMVMKVLA